MQHDESFGFVFVDCDASFCQSSHTRRNRHLKFSYHRLVSFEDHHSGNLLCSPIHQTTGHYRVFFASTVNVRVPPIIINLASFFFLRAHNFPRSVVDESNATSLPELSVVLLATGASLHQQRAIALFD